MEICEKKISGAHTATCAEESNRMDGMDVQIDDQDDVIHHTAQCCQGMHHEETHSSSKAKANQKDADSETDCRFIPPLTSSSKLQYTWCILEQHSLPEFETNSMNFRRKKQRTRRSR